MKACINCYTENALDAVFCSNCGMSLMGGPHR
jgi:ribosomal protein L40E